MLSAGKYKGKVVHHKIIKSESGSIIFLCEAIVYSKQENKEWGTVPEESVPGFIPLVKKDGTLNHRQVENLKEAFEWNGKSLKDLQDGDYSEKELNITVEVKTKEGEDKPYVEIAWINLPGNGAFTKTSEKKIAEFDEIFAQASNTKEEKVAGKSW